MNVIQGKTPLSFRAIEPIKSCGDCEFMKFVMKPNKAYNCSKHGFVIKPEFSSRELDNVTCDDFENGVAE